MTDTATAPEELTPEQQEAELQALLDKSDAKRSGDAEPESTPAEVGAPADPMKLDAEPDTEAATEPAEKTAEADTTPVKDDSSQPAKEAATEPTQSGSDPTQSGGDDEVTALRKRAAKLEQDNRSMAGRVSAYQRRYEEATGKRQPAPAPAVTAEQHTEWKNFQEEYPEIAKAIEARFAASLPEGAAAKTQELLQYVEDQKRDAFLKDAWAAVEAVHPTWRADGSTKEFVEWKKSSPTYEKLAASDDIADAIALFDLYGAHKARTQGSATPAPSPAPAPAAKASTAAADQVAARREKQAEGAAAPAGRAATPNHSVDLDDPDQLFNFYAKTADNRLRRR